MPAINPNNYNIDFFQTYSFGDLTDSDYVTYLLGQNLLNLPDELVDGAAGNFLSVWANERGLEKTINYSKIENPGDVDEWFAEGNVSVNLNDIRNEVIFKDNEYGPSVYQAYNCPQLEDPEETGFIQYPTSTGGNVVTDLLGETLDAVGLGGLNAFLIDFPSELNEVANERRLTELKNRVKQNLINETVGRINLDPLGLLAGQPLFGKDYKITKPAEGIPIPGLGVLTDLADFNLSALRKDPLPDGAFDWGQKPMDSPFSERQIDISQALLDYTGKGTQNLLYEALKINKYGPIIEGQDDPLGNEPKKAKDANQPTQKLGYLDHTYEKPVGSKEKSVTENKTKLAGIVDKIKNIGKKESEDLAPTEENNPTVKDSPIMVYKNKGFDFKYAYEMDFVALKGSWDSQHLASWSNQYYPSQITTDNPFEDVGGTFDNIGPETEARWNSDLFWKDGRDEANLPKRGLLRYTQKLINKSTGEKGRGSAAQFVGLPNSDQNYNMDSTDRRHITMSQGNLVKESKENKYYCRSWSVRNTYNRYNDLIRHDALWRETQPGTIRDGKSDANVKLGKYSTLRSPGIPKIAWEKDGETESAIMKAAQLGKLLVDKKHVIPYMFSLENLAWKDSPHHRKLPTCEKGPFGGRIMWFPPYNINFTDNTSVNWDTTSFIGRAEPIYTYNNTERTGTLSFSIVVDHPSVLNKLKDKAFKTTTTNELGEVEEVSTTTNLETFFAGCDAETTKNIVQEAFKEIIPQEDELDKLTEPELLEESDTERQNQGVPTVTDGLSFFFKNARSAFIKEIDDCGSGTQGYCSSYGYIIDESSCPDGIIGRCFDYNYEKDPQAWYDNPKLYKVGWYSCDGGEACKEEIDKYGGYDGSPPVSQWFDTIEDENTLDTEGYPLEEIPESYQYQRWDGPLPCNGKESPPLGTENRFGPKLNAVPTGSGNETNTQLWGSQSDGQAYENITFCNECLPSTGTTQLASCPAGYTLSGSSICYSASTTCPTGFTLTMGGLCVSGTTTASSTTTIVTTSPTTTPGEIKEANQLGSLYERQGFNSRFFGTGSDETSGLLGNYKSSFLPKMDIPGMENKTWKFTVDVGDGVVGNGISQLIEFLTTTWQGKGQTISVIGNTSSFGDVEYNQKLSEDRARNVFNYMYDQMVKCEQSTDETPKLPTSGESEVPLYTESEYQLSENQTANLRWGIFGVGKKDALGFVGNDANVDTSSASYSGQFIPTPSRAHPNDYENECQIISRRVDIVLTPNEELLSKSWDTFKKEEKERIQGVNEGLLKEFKDKKAAAIAKAEADKQEALELAKNFINECDYFMQIKEDDSFLYDSLKDKLRNFHPAFHSITPEGFNSRITFLQQCGRQGPSTIDPNQPQNTAFGRPPVCILRLGDFYHTKIIIDTINFTFDPLQWDLNPEGIGVQPMLCNVDLNFKFIGGSTLQGPLSALQNAVSYNFFANTALYMPLEKILTRRKSAGEILLEGDDGFSDGTQENEYFYGPFAGQEEFNDAIKVEKDKSDEVVVEDPNEAEESEEAASQGEGGNDGGPPVTGSGSGCIDETLLSEEDKSVALEYGIQDNVSSKVWADIKANPNKYDGYYCNDTTGVNAGKTTWVRKVDDINKTEEEILEEAQDGGGSGGDTDGTEIGAPNKTTDEGGLLFTETNSLKYNQGETYSNDYGKITISGDYVDAENGIGTYLSSPTDPTDGLLPNYVWGRINPDIANDYDVTITQDKGFESLDGGSGTRGVGNNAVVWNNVNPPVKETENSCCTVTDADRPAEQVGRQIFAFNILPYAINMESFEEWAFWAAGGNDGDDFYSSDLIETIQKNIDDKGVAKWKVGFYIQLTETTNSMETRVANGATGDDKHRKYESGSINIVGEIKQEGLNIIKAAVGAQ